MSDRRRDYIGMISCRFWMTYVVLYFAQLYQENKDTQKERNSLEKKDKDSVLEERQTIQNKLKSLDRDEQTWFTNLMINLAYFPMTLVSSLSSLFIHDNKIFSTLLRLSSHELIQIINTICIKCISIGLHPMEY